MSSQSDKAYTKLRLLYQSEYQSPCFILLSLVNTTSRYLNFFCCSALLFAAYTELDSWRSIIVFSGSNFSSLVLHTVQNHSSTCTSVPSKLKKRHFFWTPADKNFENRHLQIWTQFPSQKKFSQTTISLLFQRCAEHNLTI